MPGSDPLVISIVLNWNGYDDVRRCLRSLQKVSYENHDIFLIDNGSTDGSVEKIKTEFPDITIICNESNLGFSAGNNIGIGRAINQEAEYVWILNNDVVIPSDRILSNMIETMEKYNRISILSPEVKKHPEREELWFDQGVINWSTGAAYHRCNYRWYVHGPAASATSTRLSEDLRPNDYVPLCCALCRTSALSSVGLLPTGYFLYYEDVDLCTQLRENGFDIATDPKECVYHRIAGSSGARKNPTQSYYSARNRVLLAKRHSDRISSLCFPIFYTWVIISLLLERLPYFDPHSIIAVFRGVYDGVTHDFGRGPYP